MSEPVVVLDPGHGGYDPGAVAFGLEEKTLNLALGLEVAERLKGCRVLLTRERDVFVSLAERVAFSRKAGADLFLSLHANAGGGRGFESFVYSGLGPGDAAVRMQQYLHEEIMAAIGGWNIVDRGLKRAAFYVLRHNPAPAVLIESLFLDNEREAGIWREEMFIKQLAAGVTGGISRALGIDRSEGNEGNDRGSGEFEALYTVQVGAFSLIENARQRLLEAVEAGFRDAFIYHKRY